MGPHFWWSIALLAALLIFCLAIALGTQAIHSPTARQLEQAGRLAMAGRPEQAAQLAQQAKQRWERYFRLSAVLSDHTPMEETDRLFSQLQYRTEAEDFSALCAQLAQQLEAMYLCHSLNWWNLL